MNSMENLQPTNVSPEFFKCGNVIASDRGIIETDQGRQVQLVPQKTITNITLRFGCPARRPILEMVMGGALGAIGGFGGFNLCTNFKAWRYDIGLIALGCLGASMIYDVTKKAFYLRVATESDYFKITFSKNVQRAEVEAFCAEIQKRWNYNVATALI